MAKKTKDENEKINNDNAGAEVEKEATESETTEQQTPDTAKEPANTESAALAEQKDKYLRLAAEYDNFRKRTAKEKERAYSDTESRTITAFLPVLDNLERAAAAEENKESPIYKGVEMTLKQLHEVFAKFKVEEIDSSKGTPFDPSKHEAIMHEADDTLEGVNVVDDTFRKGYMKEGQVIRPALVKTRG